MSNSLPTVLFVRGGARSGTTLLADVMNQSPEIGLLVEQPLGELAARLLGIFSYEDHRIQERAAIAEAQKLADRKGASDHYSLFENLDRIRFTKRYPTRERFAHILTAVVEASLEKSELAVIGSKTPGRWSESELRAIKAMFPRVKFLFVVRNPLDTVNSNMNFRNVGAAQKLWPDKTVREAIARYQENVCLLFSTALASSTDCFVIRYEDLIDDPQKALDEVGRFLGVTLRDEAYLVGKPPTATDAMSRNVLTAAEEKLVRATFAHAIDTWADKRVTGPARDAIDQLGDGVRTVRVGERYRCSAPVGDRGLLGAGWAGSEAVGIWSEAPTADLFFCVPYDGRYAVTIRFRCDGRARRDHPEFVVRIDEGEYTQSVRRTSSQRKRFGPILLQGGRVHHLQFDFQSGVSSQADRDVDWRRLGVCLQDVTFETSR